MEVRSTIPASPLEVVTKIDQQYTRIEEIDPDLAAILLEGNVRNRSISKSTVEAYARDMVDGRWALTHQGIALDREGRLVDGQHRLTAVVRSGVTIRMAVTYNVDPETYRVVDTNARARSTADVLTMTEKSGESPLGETKLLSKNHVIAAVKILSVIDSGSVRGKFTTGETIELIRKYPEANEACALLRPRGRDITRINRAGVIAGVAFALPVEDRSLVDEFCARITTRVGMNALQAAFVRTYDKAPAGDEGNVVLAGLTMRALFATKKGKELVRIYVTDGYNVQEDNAVVHYKALREKLMRKER